MYALVSLVSCLQASVPALRVPQSHFSPSSLAESYLYSQDRPQTPFQTPRHRASFKISPSDHVALVRKSVHGSACTSSTARPGPRPSAPSPPPSAALSVPPHWLRVVPGPARLVLAWGQGWPFAGWRPLFSVSQQPSLRYLGRNLGDPCPDPPLGGRLWQVGRWSHSPGRGCHVATGALQGNDRYRGTTGGAAWVTLWPKGISCSWRWEGPVVSGRGHGRGRW